MKTEAMEAIEFRDWEKRLASDPSARKRDIREVIQAAFDEAGDQPGAAALLGIHAGTLSKWINEHLEGDIRSRVVFPSFASADEREPAGSVK